MTTATISSPIDAPVGALERLTRELDARAAEFPGRNELRLTDASHNYAAIAVQGPRVKDFINDCFPGASVSAMRVKAVTDLKVEDFEVYEDGRLQKITNFSFVSSASLVPSSEGASKPSRTKGVIEAPVPTVHLRPEKVERTFADGERVTAPVPLAHDVEIRLGPVPIRFRRLSQGASTQTFDASRISRSSQ